MNNGTYYTNTNKLVKCQYKYVHLDFFEDTYNKYIQKNVIPIDIEMYQYIKENYISNKLPNKVLNYINHFCNIHNAKNKFYIFINDSLLIFISNNLNNVSNLQKNKFKRILQKYDINSINFYIIKDENN
jgi:hypothetical protein